MLLEPKVTVASPESVADALAAAISHRGLRVTAGLLSVLLGHTRHNDAYQQNQQGQPDILLVIAVICAMVFHDILLSLKTLSRWRRPGGVLCLRMM